MRGSPIGCAAALAVLDVMAEEKLADARRDDRRARQAATPAEMSKR